MGFHDKGKEVKVGVREDYRIPQYLGVKFIQVIKEEEMK